MTSRRWARALAAGTGLVVVTACAAAYVVDPYRIGGLLFTLCAAAAILAMIVGPVVLRRPRHAWRVTSAGAVLFLVSLLTRLLPSPPSWGPLALPDALFFMGNLFLTIWLAGLVRRTTASVDRRLWLDTLLVAAGASLAVWAVTIAPLLETGEGLGQALVVAAYPIFDVVLLTLSVQLVFRSVRRVPALWAILIGLLIIQIVDTAYTFVWAGDVGANIPALSAFFLFAYVSVAFGICHPSYATLYQPRGGVEAALPVRRRRAALLLSMISPTAVSTLYPLHGRLDVAVRVVLLVVLFSLIFLRLTSTMTALSDAEAESRHRAVHDALTGLPNRVGFTEELQRRLSQSADARRPWLSVLYLDCDNFKHVNDTWGHPVGDALLVQVAERLSGVIRRDDMLARVGGDEFVIIAQTRDPEDATRLADRALSAFEIPHDLVREHPIRMTPSIGIAQCRVSGETPAVDLVRDADIALYRAKSNGRAGWILFDETLRAQLSERVLLAESLCTAVADGQIDVDFQPIMGGAGYAQIVGWEALARWRHPHHGDIPPEVFIPIAEDSGFILDIGEFMLRRSCEELARVRAESGRDDVHVSVNVSPVQMTRGDLAGVVAAVLNDCRLPASMLWLEMTESSIVQRGSEAAAMLRSLHDLGVTLCMDDFGTGYSSLGALHQFPVDIVKVDRSFVRDLAGDPRAVALTRAIIEMVSALGLRGVVAEGVETAEQAAALAQLRCPMVQGWLYGRPRPAAEVHLERTHRKPDIAVEAIPLAS